MTVETPSRPVAAWLPAAAAATTLLLWASAFVAIRHLGETVTPGALSLARLAVAAAALGLLLALPRRPRRTSGSPAGRGPRWPVGRQWWLMLVCGASWFGVYNLALNESERRIDAGTAAMLVQVGPLLVALLAVVFLGEVFSRWVLAGVLLGLSGIVVIGTAMTDGADGDLVGVLLGVLAAGTYAIGVVTQKPLVRTLPAMEVTWLACMIGAIVCLPWTGDLVEVVRTADAGTLLLLGYLGLFPTALAFTTWAFALHHFDASRLAILTFLVPVLTVLIAWATLGETPPAAAYLGGALCIAGVLLSRRRPVAPPTAVAPPVVDSVAACDVSPSGPGVGDGAGTDGP